MTTEVVVQSRFLEGPVQPEGKLQPAPREVMEVRNKFCQTWLRLNRTDRSVVPVVRVDPVFRTQPTGWKVEKIVINKKDTATFH